LRVLFLEETDETEDDGTCSSVAAREASKPVNDTNWDAFKLRASEALGLRWSPEALAQLQRHMETLAPKSQRHLAWLAMHPPIVAIFNALPDDHCRQVSCFEEVLLGLAVLREASLILDFLNAKNAEGTQVYTHVHHSSV